MHSLLVTDIPLNTKPSRGFVLKELFALEEVPFEALSWLAMDAVSETTDAAEVVTSGSGI